MKKYDHTKIEKKWQKEWKKEKVYKTADPETAGGGKPKYYILDMFPYPSGEGLHVGHPKGYIATDIVSRMKRMQGFNVLHPMGFDAFGLPAENYALKTKTNPADSVAKNVARYKKQLEIMGFDYDWSREVNTTDPKFYKWTQWIFLKLLEKGLAYESFEPINWCPSCKTGLANEDVEDGRCERCGTVVEKKPMRQWVLRITDYADRLLADLDTRVLANGDLFWTNQKGEPGMTQMNTDNPGRVRQDKKFVERQAVCVFVEHWEGGKFIVLKWKKVDWLTPITGGVEKGQTIEETARAEVREETGFKNLELVRQSKGQYHSTFFHPPKDENRVGHFTAFHFKLKDGIRDEVIADELAKHEVLWVEKDKVRDMMTAEAAKLGWDLVMEGKVCHETKPLLDWPESIKEAQRNWIGRSEGAQISFNLKAAKRLNPLEVFTTRPDTLFGVTYVVVAPEHELVTELLKHKENLKNHDDVVKYVASARMMTLIERTDAQKDKTGIELKGVTAINPVNNEEVPVYVADYVLAEYGTGAVMAVPAHDERDFEFAKKYKLPTRSVIDSGTSKTDCYTEEGILINSGEFNKLHSTEAKKKITSSVGGKWVVKYKLKNWVFSRQRYWGEPFPLLRDGNAVIPVAEKDLPVELPKVKSYEPTGTGESPLAAIEKWVNVKMNGKIMRRETNTMPQWAGSSWYYLRFMDPDNKKSLVDPKNERYWNKVDFYVGGAEHATRHLIYARFWHKFLYDIGVVSTIEPFIKLQSVGLIMGEDGRKMSKRFGNVVNPDDIVKTYGADTMRIYEMFMGPFDQAIAWNTNGMVGSRRFIERVWKLAEKVGKEGVLSKETEILLNKTIKKVTEDIAVLHHNTAVSSLMILSNELERSPMLSRAAYETFLKLLAPLAPHMTEELWRGLGNKTSIHTSSWPVADESKISAELLTITVQINGKMRASFSAPKDAPNATLEQTALGLADVKKWIGDTPVKKVIIVPNRLVSIVTA